MWILRVVVRMMGLEEEDPHGHSVQLCMWIAIRGFRDDACRIQTTSVLGGVKTPRCSYGGLEFHHVLSLPMDWCLL